MKILIVGDANSIFIKKYIEYVLLPQKYDISLLCDRKSNVRYLQFYQDNLIELIETAPNFWTFIDRIPKIRGVAHRLCSRGAMRAYINQFGLFDIIHIHGIWNYAWDFSYPEYGNAVICTYWGSDLFRFPQNNKHMRACLMRSKYITVSTKEMKQKFNELFGEQFDKKIMNVKFGVNLFESIDAVLIDSNKEQCKQHFSIDSGKTVLSIGYNAKKEHQHLAVINAISRLPLDILLEISIVLQMTCGYTSDNYISEVKKALNQLPCQSLVLTSFMSDSEVAKLRIASDIFIHAQTTDAFSASIQEYIYAGALVINPTWIPYSVLKANNIRYLEYSCFDEITNILSTSISERIFAKCVDNRETLRKISSWPFVAPQWNQLYEQLK